jgi:hypothetical protein
VEVEVEQVITLGESGKTIALACGASQTGFGRTGTVDWCSTIHTNSPGTVTAVSGKGYFLNTTSGTITINLPSSPTVGDIVSIKDYANTFDDNNVTLGRGGSKIGGLCIDATLSTEGESLTLIYADSTKGWLNVQTDSTVQGVGYVAATGGTIATVGDYKIHTFNADGCFQVTNAGTPGGSNTVDYLVVAGGGGGGGDGAGGGGAGGYRESVPSPAAWTGSPLANPANARPVSVQTYPIAVGGGGVGAQCGSTSIGANGAVSTFSDISSAGGGKGGASGCTQGGSGGSGGGSRSNNAHPSGGAGNTPPVSPPQGNAGGGNAGGNMKGGGGGGATAVGTAGPAGPMAGGAGATSSINNTPTARAGGGGGGLNGTTGPGGPGGTGGGGAGGGNGPGPAVIGTNGTANTGGGGGGSGGGSPGRTGGTGGSGVVILRYKFQ